MLNRFVFILPTSDWLDYGSCVMEDVISKYTDIGDKYVVLKGKEATPSNIKEAIDHINPSMIAGIGHGSPCAYTVQNKEFFLMYPDPENKCEELLNMDLVRGRVWFLNSCEVGKELGKVMVEVYGAKAFLGSKEPFLFPVFDKPCSSDDIKAVFEAEYVALKYLLRGFTVGEAHRARLRAYDELIKDYTFGIRSLSPNAPLVVRLLRIDRDIAVVYGDTKAIVATPEPTEKSSLAQHPAEMGLGIVAIAVGCLAVLSEALSKLRKKRK